MKDNETIVEMITRFTDIVNGLETLGKTYKESEKVMKILRSLPSKWHTKVTTIQEAKDLTKLPLEELIGSLMTYEIVDPSSIHWPAQLAILKNMYGGKKCGFRVLENSSPMRNGFVWSRHLLFIFIFEIGKIK